MAKRIMVVDDSRVVRAEMEKMLEGSDMEICEFCRSGEEALEKFEKAKPDLVTMDIVMPGMDGMETCKMLRQRYPEANVFMVSSMAYDDMIDRAVELGANKIVPVLTERCVSRPNAKSFEKKLERFNKIALEAAKQCGRCIYRKYRCSCGSYPYN